MPVVDPEFAGFAANVARLGEITGCDTAHLGTATSTPTASGARSSSRSAPPASDHGHPTARTEDLPQAEAAALFAKVLAGKAHARDEADAFRGQMLTEMARMSLDDGLVLQIHPGSWRNHSTRGLRHARPRQGLRHPHAHRLRRGR